MKNSFQNENNEIPERIFLSVSEMMSLFDNNGTRTVFLPFDESKVSAEEVLSGFAYHFQDFRFRLTWEYAYKNTSEDINEYLGRDLYDENDTILAIAVKGYIEEDKDKFLVILHSLGLNTVSELLERKVN